jgi:hypothetical protein
MSVSPSPVLPVSPPPPPVRVRRAHSTVAEVVEEVLPIRILFGSIWILLLTTFVTWDAVFYGIIRFISNFAACVGLVGIFISAFLPVVYVIIPTQTQNFKFVSLSPIIEYALHKFDDFITSAKQTIAQRM